MSPKWCPGSASFRQPKLDLFKCPDCGAQVEIWSDEATRPCPACGRAVFRTGMQSCLEWCKRAKECVGEQKYKQYGEMKAALRKQALIRAMEDYFGQDARRIRHAKAVVAYAERILSETEGADPNVVIAAAALHDTGIRNAEEKYGSAAPEYQETEGPPVARVILMGLGYEEKFIQEVCDIIAHHHSPRSEETINFEALYDADLLVNLEETRRETETRPAQTPPNFSTSFRTPAGRRIAVQEKLIASGPGEQAIFRNSGIAKKRQK